MNARTKSGRPLHGVRVLVGRARHQAGALSAELRKQGAQVIEIPFIDIRPPRSYKPLDSALKSLTTYDWLILTSVNGVAAMWERLAKLGIVLANQRSKDSARSGVRKDNASAPMTPAAQLCIAAIGPATRKAIEQRGARVDIVPEEYVAESVVRSLESKVRGKRVLLVRAKVARDVIPEELRRAGAHVDVVEAYETVVPRASRERLMELIDDPKRRPHVVTFTSSSTVRNFIEMLGLKKENTASFTPLHEIRMASIGPVTSATLREFGLPVQIAAKEFTIPGLVSAIATAVTQQS